MGELDLAGGKLGGGGQWKRADEKLVVEELVSDLGESVGWKDGDSKREAVLGVVIVFLDGGRAALTQLHLALKTGDTKVLGHMEIVEKNFP